MKYTTDENMDILISSVAKLTETVGNINNVNSNKRLKKYFCCFSEDPKHDRMDSTNITNNSCQDCENTGYASDAK